MAIVTQEVLKKPPAKPPRLTEAEFVAWCDADTWAEWVDGEVIVMSPVSAQHSRIFGFLFPIFQVVAQQGDQGEVHCEPFQVRLPRQRRRRSPDIFFFVAARREQLREHDFEGAPDLIVEIVSPESVVRDWREKYHEYKRAGVREYWVVDPMSQRLEAYALQEENRYRQIEENRGVVRSIALPSLAIKPAWLWRAQLPKVQTALREMKPKRRKKA